MYERLRAAIESLRADVQMYRRLQSLFLMPREAVYRGDRADSMPWEAVYRGYRARSMPREAVYIEATGPVLCQGRQFI